MDCSAHSVQTKKGSTYCPSVNNYESLGLCVEVTVFDGLGLTGNYVAQIVFRFFEGPKRKLGLDVSEIHHPFCCIAYDVTFTKPDQQSV